MTPMLYGTRYLLYLIILTESTYEMQSKECTITYLRASGQWESAATISPAGKPHQFKEQKDNFR